MSGAVSVLYKILIRLAHHETIIGTFLYSTTMEKIQKFIKEDPRKAFAVFAVVVIAFALLLGLVTRPQTDVDSSEDSSDTEIDQQEDTRTAYVYALEDTTVTARIGEGGRLTQIDSPTELTAGSTVQTTSGSYAMVMLENGTSIVLGPDSEAVIYVDERYSVELLSGKGWIRTTDDSTAIATLAELTSSDSSVTLEFLGSDLGVLVQTGSFTLEVFDESDPVASVDLSEFNDITVSSDSLNDYEGGALEEFVTAADQSALDQDQWFQFTTCLDAYLASLLGGGDLPDTDTVEEGLSTCSSIVIEPSDAGEEAEVTVESVTAKFTGSTTLSCSWESDANDIQGYAYWIGTSPGDDDVKSETFIEDTEADYTFSPDEDEMYYCSVRVITADGSGEKTSAAAVPMDEISAELNISEPDSGDEFDGIVRGDVESSADYDDLSIRISIQSDDGKYYSDSGWRSGTNYYETDLDDDFEFQETISFDPDDYDEGTVKIEVLDSLGSVLDQVVVSVNFTS